MPALATILAISGCIVLGLILTLGLWLISRWMGKVAGGSNLYRAGGRAGTQPPADTRNSRTLLPVDRTHSPTGSTR